MYCTNCGTNLDGNSKFCSNCGSKIFQEPARNSNRKLFCIKHALDFLESEGCPECHNQPLASIKIEPKTVNDGTALFFCKKHGILLKRDETCSMCISHNRFEDITELLNFDKQNPNILELIPPNKNGFLYNLKKTAINSGRSSFVTTARTLASQYLSIKNANPDMDDYDIFISLADQRYKLLPLTKMSIPDLCFLIQKSDKFDLSAFVWIILLAETDLADLDDDSQILARLVINKTLTEYEGI